MITLRSKVLTPKALRGGLFPNQNNDHIVAEHHSERFDVDPLAPTYLGPLACNSRTVYSKLYDSKSMNSIAPGNDVRNNSDATQTSSRSPGKRSGWQREAMRP
jgi:hypothetical protein